MLNCFVVAYHGHEADQIGIPADRISGTGLMERPRGLLQANAGCLCPST